MRKYRPQLQETELKELQRLSQLDFSTFSEADVREEFLVELLKLLGYRKDLDYSVSREESFKLNPLFLSVGSTRIKLDYLCSLRKQYFWIIDAKEGKCKDRRRPPEIDRESITQTHFYALRPDVNCRYFIVSNGWYTNLYDRDTLDESLSPLLTIKSRELAERFLELDSYVGATQLLSKVKVSILDQIEKVFAAEVRVERLDEFMDAVAEKAGKARAKVEKAAYESYQKHHSDDGGFTSLETEDISTSVYPIFQSLRTRAELDRVAGILTRRFQANHQNFQFKEYFFFSRLMLEKPYPVNFWYYPGVLHFLFRAHKEGVSSVYYGEKTIQDLLTEWLDLCLFHLSKRKVLRYLWACERMVAKITKQSVLLFPSFRSKITDLLNKELFYLPEEKLGFLGPNQAKVTIGVVETSLAYFRSRFIQKYCDEYGVRFKEQLALQEYRRLEAVSMQIDTEYGEVYNKIKKELGSGWQDLMAYEYPYHDRMGSAVFDILTWNKDQLHLLTDEQKSRIKLVAELGCTSFADGLCDTLGIAFNRNLDAAVRENAMLEFFDPAVDQYGFTI